MAKVPMAPGHMFGGHAQSIAASLPIRHDVAYVMLHGCCVLQADLLQFFQSNPAHYDALKEAVDTGEMGTVDVSEVNIAFPRGVDLTEQVGPGPGLRNSSQGC